MATFGGVYIGTGGVGDTNGTHYYADLIYTISQTDTTFTVTVATIGYNNWKNSGRWQGVSAFIDGAESYNAVYMGPYQNNGNQEHVRASRSKTVSKLANTQTIKLQGWHGVDSGGSGGGAHTAWASATYSSEVIITVPTLPQASLSEVAKSGNDLDGNTSLTAKWTPVSTMTYQVVFSMGSYSSTVTAGAGASSATFKPPLSWLAAIPNALSGAITVELKTMSGAVQMGTASTKAVILTAPATAVPTIGALIYAQIYDLLSPAVPSTWNLFVQNRSGLHVEVGTCSGYQGSTISSITIAGGGYSSNTSVLDTGVLKTSGVNTFTVTAKDSRGRNATKTFSITVQPYGAPYFSAVLTQRANAAGTLDSSGSYALGTATYGYSALGSANPILRSLRYRETGTDAWIAAEGAFASGVAKLFGGALATDKSYDVLYTLSDAFQTVSRQDMVSRSMPIMEFGMGGLALAIGKEPDRVGLDVDWVAHFSRRTDFDTMPYVGGQPATAIVNGGTGQTTAALARNALGLGNTTGPLPPANGGTGRTDCADTVIQQGNSGSWYIRKWASGRKEAWLPYSAGSLAFTTAVAGVTGIYVPATQPSVALPSGFFSVAPAVYALTPNGTGYNCGFVASATVTALTLRLWMPYSTTAVAGGMIYCAGT
ncbi:MAG: DUF859 domain-containing protein [Coriobacteriales bacterium]|jgi:hypothetical protein|nr:DUF859 domain-containing protein [Coriobacteriales bacterium]